MENVKLAGWCSHGKYPGGVGCPECNPMTPKQTVEEEVESEARELCKKNGHDIFDDPCLGSYRTVAIAKATALRDAQEKSLEQAQLISKLYWHDCLTEGERGVNHCQFEGTHVCTVCQLASAREKIERLEKENEKLRGAVIRGDKIRLAVIQHFTPLAVTDSLTPPEEKLFKIARLVKD